MTELNLYHKSEDLYRMLTMSPNTVRWAIENIDDYREKINLHELVIRDDQYLSKKQDRDSIFRKCEWSLETSGNERIDEFVKEQIWKALDNNILQALHESLYQGFSVIEIIWDKNSIASLKALPQKAFNFKDGKLYIYDGQMNKYYEIPENKTMISYAPIKVNYMPVGLSEILAPVICVKYSAMFKDWPHFNEFVAMPMLWGYYHNEETKKALNTALASLGRASIGTMPMGSDIKFIEASNNNPEAFDRIIKMCDQSISKTVIGQTLTTESTGSGSYAQAKVQNSVREDFQSLSVDLVCDTINRDLIKPLVNFNFSDRVYPTFSLKVPTLLEEKATRDKMLYDIGVRFTPQYFIENYGLPEDHFTIQERSSNPFENLNSEVKKKTQYFS